MVAAKIRLQAVIVLCSALSLLGCGGTGAASELSDADSLSAEPTEASAQPPTPPSAEAQPSADAQPSTQPSRPASPEPQSSTPAPAQPSPEPATPPAAAPAAPDANVLFWTPEQTLAGFKRIGTMFPTHPIARGAQVLDLPKGEPEPRIEFVHGGTSYDLDSYMQEFRVTGVLAIQRGTIRLERYALEREEADPWISFSVTKSITSTLLGAALHDGYIEDLNDPVSRYVPELAGSAYEAVNLRQLLTMTSGVKWNEDYSDSSSDVAVYNSAAAGEPGEPIVNYMRRLPRASPPGERFNYSTGEADLVGVVVRRAIGQPLADYLSERIWKPFGMEHDANWLLDASGNELGGCCISMTLRDYGRFGLFMLGGDVLPDGNRVLPEGWIAEATSRHIDAYPGVGYGYLWWVYDAAGSFDADGIFGQLIHVVPSEDLVLVHNSAWARPAGADVEGARTAFLLAVQRALARR